MGLGVGFLVLLTWGSLPGSDRQSEVTLVGAAIVDVLFLTSGN